MKFVLGFAIIIIVLLAGRAIFNWYERASANATGLAVVEEIIEEQPTKEAMMAAFEQLSKGPTSYPIDWRVALRVKITEAIAEWQREGNGPNSYNPNERGGLPQTTLWIDKADQFGKVATDAAIAYFESITQ